MSTLAHHEPYRLRAGAMALAVHAAFFAFLYFGFSWHTEAPQGMVVDLWGDLPQAKKASAAKAADAAPPQKEELPKPAPPKVVEPPKPAEQRKADIELKDKKKQPEKPKPEEKPEPKPLPKPAPKVDARAQQQAEAEQAAEAAQAAARGKMIDEYVARIRAKIKRNIVMPPGVPDDAEAQFGVTLLPDGEVLEAQLQKSSGNTAYDNAVERAILKAQPLPLPPDVTLFNRNFRNLNLKFRPKE